MRPIICARLIAKKTRLATSPPACRSVSPTRRARTICDGFDTDLTRSISSARAGTLRPMAIVRTLGGDLAPEALGPTLIHEHLVVDVRRPEERGAGYVDDLETIVGPMLEHMRALQ